MENLNKIITKTARLINKTKKQLDAEIIQLEKLRGEIKRQFKTAEIIDYVF